MNKRILLIEDDRKKIEDIKGFIHHRFANFELQIKESYQSGLRELANSNYDALLLDMSLPTWESSGYEATSSFEKFGGFNIMKEMDRKGFKTKTIFITMFDDFGESDSSITLEQINNILQSQFSDFYLGYVFYNSRETQWQTKLHKFLSDL